MPDSLTKLCCLLGDPVDHSISPLIHNMAFESLGLNFAYLAFRVTARGLEKVILGLREVGFAGANVTMPHKEAVIRFLHEMDPLARKVGAVNTLLNKDGRVIGYNTDIQGFLEPLKRRMGSLEGLTVVMMGAGGAARAGLTALVNAGCRDVLILNRTLRRGRELAERLERNYPVKAVAKKMTQKELDNLSDIDLLVNATPLNSDHIPASGDLRFESINAKDVTAYDLVYNPVETLFLKEMKAGGAKVIYGYEMLVEQAALSFKLWTGKEPNKKDMLANALKALGEAG